MYIQQEKEQEGVLQLPSDYSGNAFATDTREQERQSKAADVPPVTEEEPPREEEAVPVWGRGESKKDTSARKKGWGSLLSDIPLFSSFLPPPRSKEREHDDLFGWLLVGAAVLLFLNDSIDDILPLLLLLLLWD